MAETPTPRTDSLDVRPAHDWIGNTLLVKYSDLQHLARVAGEATKPITMQDVRLCTGEGALKPEHVLRAVNIVLKQRLSEITRIQNQTK